MILKQINCCSKNVPEKLKIIKQKSITFDISLFLKKKPFITRITVINNKLFFTINDTFINTKTNGYVFINTPLIKRII